MFINRMKRLLIILSFTIALGAHAQTQSKYMSNNEIQAYLDTLVAHKEELKGKTMGYFYQKFEQVGLPMRYFGIDETSPWIDPEGKSYLTDAVLYTEELEDMNDGKEYFDIRFELDIPKIDSGAFYRSLPDDTYERWWNAFKQQTMNMPIKDIRYFRDILPLNF